MGVREAADEVVLRQLVKLGGSGGVIAVGCDGSIAMPFNSPRDAARRDGFARSPGDGDSEIRDILLFAKREKENVPYAAK